MLLWVVLALLTAAALIVLLRPLLRPEPPAAGRDEYDRAIFRDQLAEVEADLARGVLSAEEAAAARLEIQRRLLAAASAAAEAPAPAARPPLVAALAISGFVAAVGLGLYLSLGSPDLPDRPLAARATERALLAGDGSLDLAKARAALVATLATHPDSLEGWRLLARTDTGLRRWQDARTDYDKALALSGRSAEILEAAAEARLEEADGDVTPEAKALFEEALRKQPGLPGARFDLALARAQAGDLPGALEDWRALEKDAPAEAPWLPTLRAAIAQGERTLNAANGPAAETAPSDKPPEEVAQMMSLPPDQRMTAIRGMVAGLAAKLKEHPDDLAGWTRLARSYLVLGQSQDAADAYGKALALSPKDPALALGRAQALKAVAGEGDALSPAAIAAYGEVNALAPDQPEALWYLGLAARQGGRTDEARERWQKLLTLVPPDSPEAAEVKRRLGELGPGK